MAYQTGTGFRKHGIRTKIDSKPDGEKRERRTAVNCKSETQSRKTAPTKETRDGRPTSGQTALNSIRGKRWIKTI